MQAEEIQKMRGQELVDGEGQKLGTIQDVYLDQNTGKPEWATVKTGLFGSKLNFVPLAEASMHDDHVHAPYSKDQIKDAPKVEPDGELSQEEEKQLFEHYGVHYTEEGSVTATTGRQGQSSEGHDTSGPTTDDAMTRSEEELHVGTTRREAGRARLRKYVVTEEVQTTVPVQREELRVEREPISEANAGQALDGPAISEEEHEVVLHEEEVVVEKRAVPKERVRLGKETVSEERQVSEQVRKEQIETDEGR